MTPEQIQQAAAWLADYRRRGEAAPLLPAELRPGSLAEAFAIQQWLFIELDLPVVGWKAGLPGPDKWVLAPIASVQQGELCLFEQKSEQYSIEPELAFLLSTDLPALNEAYSEAEIKAAIAATHLALELIIRPYKADAGAEFFDQLAAGLFNQGLYIGPALAEESLSEKFELVLEYSGLQQKFDAQHPNLDPLLPLYWLVNHLSQQGIGLKQGQWVITGSYAGVMQVPADTLVKLEFGAFGQISTQCSHNAVIS
ncbi:2-keto-4-pentenoate hydratase [Rheinheimera sp. A13L]|uniref:fumarylacetoacetate hydrolase family protein n=1 Tax=Rheinheimera sp. A13L TaxID=506534 RepID=UPI000212547F|nr:fumarylacetoacetate hydrolase family protein [Rheinheimera sp. A13L]EGM78816.1 2-keto-4-pentenoate hydratase [Rheinheimera sp. A13L]